MRTIRFLAIVGALSTPLGATNVGLGAADQPVNLGQNADPSRIPLGPVAVESNYGFGLGRVITAPRPSLHGAMEWEKGSILDQNLASVFGIEVSNHDAPHTPVEIRVKPWPKPEYSPYTKEQVLAAVVHCILRTARGTQKHPIVIKIHAELPADAKVLEKFAGEYVNAVADPADAPEKPTPVPGCTLETDSDGITWVVFPDRQSAARATRRPVFIPYRLNGGDSGPEIPTWLLLPVWIGSGVEAEEMLAAIGRPYPLFYDCFMPSTGMGPEVNSLFAGGEANPLYDFRVTNDENFTATISYPSVKTGTLSATILATVLSAAPTAEKPLEIVLRTEKGSASPWLDAFRNCDGWETVVTPVIAGGTPVGERVELRCEFVWDAANAKLARGAVPEVAVTKTLTGQLLLTYPDIPQEPVVEIPAEP